MSRRTALPGAAAWSEEPVAEEVGPRRPHRRPRLVDRRPGGGRVVREAPAVVLADFETKGEASVLVRRLRGR